MRILKQSTASNIMVLMTNSADHVAGETGLTLTITASKNGGAFASITPTVTERGNGWYNLALTAAHTDTLGDLAIHITAASADPTDFVCSVFTQTFNDLVVPDNAGIAAIKAKTDNLPVDPADASDIAAEFITVNTKLDNIDNFVDTEITAIKDIANKLDSAVELDGSVYRFTTNALEQAPTGGTAPTVIEIRQEIDLNSTKLANIQLKIDRLHRARGLEVGTPATNTLTKLTAGDIDVNITGDLETTTTYTAVT